MTTIIALQNSIISYLRIAKSKSKYRCLVKNERATRLRIADLGRVVALTTGMITFQVDFFSHIDYTRTRTIQLCFVLPNKT